MMRRGTSKLSSQATQVQFSCALSAIFSATNTRRDEKLDKNSLLVSLFKVPRFPPSVCLFLSFCFFVWKDHMISYLKVAAFPVSILLTL